MSIIQEALKRQDEDNPKIKPENQASEHPPPVPPDSKKRHWIGVLLALLILLAAGTGVYILLQVDWSGNSEAEEKPKIAADTPATGSTENDVQPAEPKSGVGRIVSKVKNALSASEENALPIEPDVAAAVKSEPKPEPDPPASEPDTRVADADPEAATNDLQKTPSEPEADDPVVDTPLVKDDPVEEVEPATVKNDTAAPAPNPKEPVRWPQIHIRGIMAPSGSNRGAVLIDDRMMSEGDSYKEVRILKISRTNVLLEFEDEKRSLSTGQTIGN